MEEPDAYLDRSVALEAVLVAYLHDLADIAANARPEQADTRNARAAELLAEHARGEIQRCLRARTLYRRLRHRPQAEIILALCEAGLCDHASALVTEDWEAQRLAVHQ